MERGIPMGDGVKLKEILEAQGKSVRSVATETSISPTTLYSIIQKDTSIRFDFALRIANVLGIEVSEICSDAAMNAESWTKEQNIVLPELPSGMDSVLDGNRVEYSCAMKSHFRKFGNQMSGSGNHLCKYASLLA